MKNALIIANTEYIDQNLAKLSAPGKDAEDFARVLRDKEIGAFDNVQILLNQSEPVAREAIDEFFDQKKPDDLLVLYFSGHGVRDEMGALYLAVKNTNHVRLRSTAIKSDFIREAMDQSRSKKQVVILDCCNSGAFAQGTKAVIGGSVGTAPAFEGTGYGRIVLTASDSTQFAWEGDKVIGEETQNSLFTHFLIQGLEGEADLDSDGRITVDELFDYAYEQIIMRTPKQTPGKWSYKQQGEIILRQFTRIENIKPVSLPNELIEAIEDSRTFVREGAVKQLEKLLKGKNLGLVHSAREALEKMAAEDDSRRVAQGAAQVLEVVHPTKQLAAHTTEEELKVRVGTQHIAEIAKAEQLTALPKNPLKRLVSQIKNIRATKMDIGYWSLTMVGMAVFMYLTWSNSYNSTVYYYAPFSNWIGSGLYQLIFPYDFFTIGSFFILMIYLIGCIIQIWIISKYQKLISSIWIVITIIIPFGLAIINRIADLNSWFVWYDWLYELLGNYFLWILIPLWILIFIYLTMRVKTKSS